MNFSDKDELERERYIVTHFDEALEDGWIEVYFQPVVRTMTANLCGMEGLARWNDPEWGMIGPYLFIPVLEDHDLIARLDLYMLEQICALYRKRTDAGEGFVPVSVNFSRRDFNIMDMVPTIDEVVTRYRMPREFLHIEITESGSPYLPSRRRSGNIWTSSRPWAMRSGWTISGPGTRLSIS